MKMKYLLKLRNPGYFNHTTSARNVIIFGADMSFSKHGNNKANNIYVMGKNAIQEITDNNVHRKNVL